MGLDTSIYGNLQPVQQPSVADTMGRAMSLSQMAMQQQMAQRQMQIQLAARQAYADNLDPSGNLNRAGYLSAIRSLDPTMAMQTEEQLAKTDKATAEAGSAQADDYQHRANLVATGLQWAKNQPDQEGAYNSFKQSLEGAGVAKPGQLPAYSPEVFDDLHTKALLHQGVNSKDYLANQETKAKIAETQANIGMMPAKINAELYGSRSPNAEVTGQYDKQAAPIRSSQIAMQQMLDNYKNPSPQGDKSLVLNAYKIKFPNSPDVNSLEELTKAQSVPDTWKAMATHALEGGLDQGTRDNLMRDGVSTYRANVDSLRGIQERTKARQQVQNINDPSLTYEPAIEKTFADAMDVQKKIGPYVPPSKREGGLISKLFGAGEQSANAGERKTAPAPAPSGSIKMRFPDGKLKWIPADQKGRAIDAGGSVVK